ncbi:hypothetical protein D3C84_1268430 [compost metagenome]
MLSEFHLEAVGASLRGRGIHVRPEIEHGDRQGRATDQQLMLHQEHAIFFIPGEFQITGVPLIRTGNDPLCAVV